MQILNLYKSCAAALLIISAGSVFAQKGTVDQPIAAPDYPGVNKDWRNSLTNDGVWDRVRHDTKPIPWQPIREADILWKKRVWREIDTREKQNVGFRFAGDENSGGGMFIEILMDGLKRGKIEAFSNVDDRFTTKLTKQQLVEMTAGKDDTVKVYDPTSDTYSIRVTHTDFNPEIVTKYRIKEDWIFDRNEGKMVVRIVGLAPMEDIYGEDGGYRATRTMFWLYYPDIREFLAKYEVVNPMNDMYRYTWDEFFESRMFASKIVKVSNPFNRDLFDQSVYPNKMESLYEGQRAADEIFNKEHDMWVY